MAACLTIVVLAVASASCDPAGLDDDSLESLPQIDALDYASVQPAEDWDYWELRHVFPGSGGTVEIMGNGGPLTRAQLAPDVVEALDQTEPLTGFHPSCLPAYCFDFVAAVRGSDITVFSTEEGLRLFLGDLDVVAEAALVVHGMGFYWSPTESGTGYRERGSSGWEFVVLELVRTCAPVETDRVLLRVDATGPVTELDRETWRSEEGVCI